MSACTFVWHFNVNLRNRAVYSLSRCSFSASKPSDVNHRWFFLFTNIIRFKISMAKSTDRRLLAMTLIHSLVCRFAQSKVWIDYFVCQSYAVKLSLDRSRLKQPWRDCWWDRVNRFTACILRKAIKMWKSVMTQFKLLTTKSDSMKVSESEIQSSPTPVVVS